MEYLTTCYRRQGEGGCSLLLLQYICRGTPVCFACLCTGGDSLACRGVTEALLGWSRSVPWHRAAVRSAPWTERLGRELAALPELKEPGAEPGLRLTVLLCIGEELLALGGGQSLLLLSTSFGRGRTLGLPGQFRGSLEPGAGLLLATEGFMKNAGDRSLEGALRIRELKSPDQAGRRLKELGTPRRQSALQGQSGALQDAAGGGPAAAILLVGR